MLQPAPTTAVSAWRAVLRPTPGGFPPCRGSSAALGNFPSFPKPNQAAKPQQTTQCRTVHKSIAGLCRPGKRATMKATCTKQGEKEFRNFRKFRKLRFCAAGLWCLTKTNHMGIAPHWPSHCNHTAPVASRHTAVVLSFSPAQGHHATLAAGPDEQGQPCQNQKDKAFIAPLPRRSPCRHSRWRSSMSPRGGV